MLLVVDVGNTNIVLGVYRGQSIVATWRLSTDARRMADEYAALLHSLFTSAGLSFRDVRAIAVASVVPPLITVFQELAQRFFEREPFLVGPGVKTGVRVQFENPKEVGADRVANALACYRRYGGPAVVIDLGTATTFDAISAEGDYLGGDIAPGITIAADALFQRTARLPRIELVAPKTAIGRTTVSGMQSGIVFGYVGLIEGMVARFKRELGPARVIATGGLARVIARETPLIEVVDPNLTLDGIRMIYELNHKGAESGV